MNTPESHISAERVALAHRTRFNPIRQLDPAQLGRWLDEFSGGTLRNFALLADAVARRDDTLAAVLAKRTGAPARHGYQVIIGEEVAEAQQAEAAQHAAALKHFYAHLRVRDAVRRDMVGGFKLLVRQMLSGALGLGYCAHETLWEPGPDGLTATLQHVPLWFFEARTGALRFLPSEGAWDGVELKDGEWFITAAPTALMEPSCVAYCYKRMSLGDALNFSERFGFPIMDAVSDAPMGSAEWTSLSEAVAALGRESSIVRSRGTELNAVQVGSAGLAPFLPLVEEMNRALSRIWRGADLSTISSGAGTGHGASLQGDETDALEDDDIALINETLNEGLDRRVIEWTFGEGVTPLAYVRIVKPQRRDLAAEVAVDTFLLGAGAPLGVADVLERYGRQAAKPGAEVLTAPKPSALSPQPSAGEPDDAAANEAATIPHGAVFAALADQFAPLRERLATILAMEDAAAQQLALRSLAATLPEMLIEHGAGPELVAAITQEFAAAVTAGLKPEPAVA